MYNESMSDMGRGESSEKAYIERPQRVLVGQKFEPITHSSLLNPNNIPLFFDLAARSAVKEHPLGGQKEVMWDRLCKQIDGYVVDLKNQNPNTPEAEIEAVCDLLFGPFRLSQAVLVNGASNEYEKEISARIQQNMVHGIIFASSREARPEFTEAVYHSVNTIDSLANTEKGHRRGLKAFWNGVKTELAITKALLARGYSLRLPDYGQDNAEIPAFQNEVLEWDVRGGVDLIAAKDGYVFFINAKGRRSINSLIYGTYVEENLLEGIPSSLKYLYRNQLNTGNVKRLTVLVDTSLNTLPKLSNSVMSLVDKRRSMSQFGVSEFQKEIGIGVDRFLALAKAEES